MIRDDGVYLAHITDAVQQILAYTEGMDLKEFRATRMVQDGYQAI